MPCSCDHYEPNEREKELQRAAKCYVWFVEKLNAVYKDEGLEVCTRDIPNGMRKASDNEWGNGCGDTVAELCDLLHDVGETNLKMVINDNFSDPMAGQVMSWWSKHLEVDKRQAALRAVSGAVWLSNDKEVDGILEMNPDLRDDISKLIAEKTFKHEIRKREYENASEFQKAFMIVPDTHKFRRFIKDEDWEATAQEYRPVDKDEPLTAKHYELSGVVLYTTDVECPKCGATKTKWCAEPHKICDERKQLWQTTKEMKARIALGGYP